MPDVRINFPLTAVSNIVVILVYGERERFFTLASYAHFFFTEGLRKAGREGLDLCLERAVLVPLERCIFHGIRMAA